VLNYRIGLRKLFLFLKGAHPFFGIQWTSRFPCIMHSLPEQEFEGTGIKRIYIYIFFWHSLTLKPKALSSSEPPGTIRPGRSISSSQICTCSTTVVRKANFTEIQQLSFIFVQMGATPTGLNDTVQMSYSAIKFWLWFLHGYSGSILF